MSNERIVVGIDVGSTKVVALIAEITDDDRLEIIGVGVVASRGMRKGVVVNSDEVIESIETAVQKAEQQSGFKIVSAFVGISGAHIVTQASRGSIAIRQSDHQIAPEDVARAIDAARGSELPSDREVLQVLTRRYTVDGQNDIKNPIGMIGHRMEVEATIVSGTTAAVQNLQRCVERAGIGIDSLVLQPLAAAEGVLTEAERDVGAAVIDIGGGTTDVGVFNEGALLFATVLPVGGFQISNDIAVGLHTSFGVAEEIKIRHGHALPEVIEEDRTLDVTSFDTGDERPVSRREVSEMIEARVEETLYLVGDQLGRAGVENLPGWPGAVRRDESAERTAPPGGGAVPHAGADRRAERAVRADRPGVVASLRRERRAAALGNRPGVRADRRAAGAAGGHRQRAQLLAA